MEVTLASSPRSGNEPGARTLEHTRLESPMCRATTRLGSAPRSFLLVCPFFTCAGAAAEDWTLSADDMALLDRREVLLPPDPAHDRGDGNFRAAIEIDAPAARVFRTMTDCAQ